MNIKINDQFRIKSDINNFIVEEMGIVKTTNKETQEVVTRVDVVKTTYHPTLVYALRHIQNQSIKDEEISSLQEVIQKIEEACNKFVMNKLQELKYGEK